MRQDATAETDDGDHSRIKTPATIAVHDLDWQHQRHDWPGNKTVIMIEPTRRLRLHDLSQRNEVQDPKRNAFIRKWRLNCRTLADRLEEGRENPFI